MGKAQSPPRIDPSVGSRIRAIRLRRDLTLSQLADQAGLSESFLSQLERGRAGASIPSLQNITRALGITIADLFQPDGTSNPAPLRADARPVLEILHLCQKMLLTPRTLQNLEVLICRLEPGGATADKPYTHGDSEELFLVLEGEVEIQLDDRTHAMSAGDSIVYRSSVAHRVVNTGDEIAEGLWAISPPSF